MNKICISGRLVKDCEMRFTQNNKAVTRFTIANDIGFGENKKTNFVNIVLFGCENLANYLIKGQMVNITGQLSIRSYEKDGNKKYVTEVIAESYGGVELIGSKKDDETQNTPFDGGWGTGGDDITPVEDGDMPF